MGPRMISLKGCRFDLVKSTSISTQVPRPSSEQSAQAGSMRDLCIAQYAVASCGFMGAVNTHVQLPTGAVEHWTWLPRALLTGVCDIVLDATEWPILTFKRHDWDSMQISFMLYKL